MTGANGEGEGTSENGGQPGVRVLGDDPESGQQVTIRDGRFGPFVQLGEGEKPKRSSLPKGRSPASIDLETALKLLALPREVARHPVSGEPILASIGRYGPYVQHGKVYANIGNDDDVLEIGGNRAIDLIVAKESGGGFRRGAADPGRPLGDDPESAKPIVVKAGRFGPYVTDGETNATLPQIGNRRGGDAGGGYRASRGAPRRRPVEEARARPKGCGQEGAGQEGRGQEGRARR